MATKGEKDVLQKIVEGMDISDDELEFEDVSAEEIGTTAKDVKESSNRKSTRTRKVSENDKSNEEESIENIQTLLNSKDPLKIVKSEHKEEGVFISVNPEEENNSFLDDEIEPEQTKNPLEIPQVMLDQLDLQKFPNLKINTQDQKKPAEVPQVNSNLIQEIRKRMENRKGQQKKPPVVEVSEPTPTRGRGRPKKTEIINTKPAAKAATPKPIIRPKNVEELKATPKPSHIKKTPMRPTPHKAARKPSTDIEDISENVEEEEEDVPLMSRPRSSRKIKLTDKFKTFVAQEKTIKSILFAEDIKPIEKKTVIKKEVKEAESSETPTPRIRPRNDIQIQLKRKKEESEEDIEKILDNYNESKAGRSLRNKKQVIKPVEEVIEEVQPPAPKKMGPKSKVKEISKPVSKRKKELISESELSDGYDVVDDEDMDPDFHDSDIGSEATLSDYDHDTNLEDRPARSIMEVVKDVFTMMPTWNLHILPNTNTLCFAQIIRGVNGIPMLKKCIEIDLDFKAKVFVHQIHYKKYDGIYKSEEHLIELLQLVDAM